MVIRFVAMAVLLPLLILPNVSCLAASKVPSLTVVSRRKNGRLQEYTFEPYTSSSTPATAEDAAAMTASTSISSRTTNVKRRNKLSNGGPSQRLAYWIKSTFLPVGYPASVQPRYVQFSIWNALQDWSTSLRSTLATQRILEGVGVGRSTATAVSAVQSFLVRDAAGMAATLLFTASTQFSAYVKHWRIFADVMVDIGITLEVAAVSVPRAYFLPLLCVASVCKAVCGVAAGASNVPLVQYWGQDTADVAAKAGAQRTVVGAVGLIVSALFARWSSTAAPSRVWALYFGLTAFHIYANVQCLQTVAFAYFNPDRLTDVASAYLDAWSRGARMPLPTPTQIGRTESVLFSLPHQQKGRRRRRKIRFGVSFNDLVAQSHMDPRQCCNSLQANGYCCVVSSASSSSPSRHARGFISVALTGDATPYVKTKAYFHALLLQRVLETIPKSNPPQDIGSLTETIALQEMEPAWDRFLQDAVAAGWDVHHSNLPTLGYEVWLDNDDGDNTIVEKARQVQ